MNPKPSLCIINYNGARHLRRSLPAAWALRRSFAEILLVDDASTDDGLAWVEAEFPHVRIVRHEVNRGPTAARNTGIRAATSDRILFADNDVVLLPGCAEALAAALDDHPEAAAAQATVLHLQNPERVQYAGATAHYLGLMILEHAEQPLRTLPQAPYPTGSLVSCCFMLDRRRLEGVRFDEDIFIYYDDHDFGLALRGRGRALLAVPAARVFHGEGTEAISIRALGHYSERRVYQTIRNRWLVLAKHYPARVLALIAPALLLFETAQLLLALRRGWWRLWRDALAWMWQHRRQLRAKRRDILSRQRVRLGRLLRPGPLPLRSELVTNPLERMALRTLALILEGYGRLVTPLL